MDFFYNSCWEWVDCFLWGCSDKTIDLYHYTSTEAANEIQRTGQLKSTRGSPVSYVTAFGLAEGSKLNEGVYFTRLEPQKVSVLVNNNYGSGDLYVRGSGADIKHRHRSVEAVIIVKWPMRRILGRARYMVPDLNAHTFCGLRRSGLPVLCGGILTCALCGQGKCCCCCLGTCVCCLTGCISCSETVRPAMDPKNVSQNSQPYRRPPQDYLAKVSHGQSDVWLVPAAVVELNLGRDPKNKQKRSWGLNASVHLLQNNGSRLVPPRTQHSRGDIGGLAPKKESFCAIM